MIAKFTTKEDAQDYANNVHIYLQTFPNYIAERWSEVIEHESFYYVAIFENLLPNTEHEIVTNIPYTESEIFE